MPSYRAVGKATRAAATDMTYSTHLPWHGLDVDYASTLRHAAQCQRYPICRDMAIATDYKCCRWELWAIEHSSSIKECILTKRYCILLEIPEQRVKTVNF